MKLKILIISLFMTLIAKAEEYQVGFGVAYPNKINKFFGETKYAAFTYRKRFVEDMDKDPSYRIMGKPRPFWEGLYWQGKAGAWGDGSNNPKRSSSLYGHAGVGMIVDFNPVEIRHGWGLGGITHPDAILGGRVPQFNGEVYLGVRDKNGNGMGFQFDHYSSSGIVMPNYGRDFISLQLSKRW